MPDGQVLEFSGLTKRFGTITAVSDVTARVEPGRVTGFLGPNGAGKTTTLRVLLGLIRATAGSATIGGTAYAGLRHPMRSVGAVLEASSYHPGHTAATHLTAYAHAGGIDRSRVDEVLGLVGLADAAGRKIGGFSLGMRQRLGLAYALLGDPGVLVLDEPANGLDPEGIRWMRGFLRQLAREGRTVLVSSHLLAEVQQTVDSLLIISRGRLVFTGGIDELAAGDDHATVVDAPDREALAGALRAADVSFDLLRSGFVVSGLSPAEVGAIAASAGVALSSLHRRGPALEEVFLDLVNGTRVQQTQDAAMPAVEAAAAAPAPAEAQAPSEATAESAAEAPAESEAEATAESEAEATAKSEAEPEPEIEPDTVAEPEATAEPNAEAEPEATAEPEAESEAEAEAETEPEATAAPEAETEPDVDVHPRPDGARHAEEHREPDADEPPEPGADEPPATAGDDDRPWETFVRTEADEEADRFFASFDGARAEDAATRPEIAEPAAHEDDDEHRDGGEQR
ncbi:ATP-binding cassette domain-containing protein [Microbacter sp. GSS18]|nr:ATP-binding cassette domain-containing protein [Microbacter sp. GSS18]